MVRQGAAGQCMAWQGLARSEVRLGLAWFGGVWWGQVRGATRNPLTISVSVKNNKTNRDMSKKNQKYAVTITGVADLLFHADNILFGERVKKWQKDPANRGKSTAGDDRSPAWTWIGCTYNNRGLLVVPSDNLMTVFREGGKRVPTGQKGGTFKAATQSGIVCDEFAWPLLLDGKTVPFAPIAALADEEEFQKHEEVAVSLGFNLFVKRAKIGTAKHVRVRPRFTNWSCTGTILVTDERITHSVLLDILAQAGRYAGLGDWRPSSPKSPGPFGTFTATAEEIKA